MPIENLIDRKFGRLRVISFGGIDDAGARWVCLCRCGIEKNIRSGSLKNGTTRSCGCLRKEKTSKTGRNNLGSEIIGQRFGRLTVRRHIKKSMWRCLCDCGKYCHVRRRSLLDGVTKSCGCLRRQIASKRNLIHGHTRNQSPSQEFVIWSGMKQRCFNPKSISFKNYGGRGISICERWISGDGKRTGYQCFFDDMGKRPSREHSIDRIDNNGNYEPDNCRWATAKQQVKNRRPTKSYRPLVGMASDDRIDWNQQQENVDGAKA